MKNITVLTIILITLTGCASVKKERFKDNSTSKTTIQEKTVTRVGDTVTIDIPNIRYKDTTIVRTSYKTNTVARVIYDNQGNQKFECSPSDIAEVIKTYVNETKKDVDSKKDSETSFNPQYLIYSIAFLGFIIVLCILVGLYLFNGLKRSIPLTIKQITDNK